MLNIYTERRKSNGVYTYILFSFETFVLFKLFCNYNIAEPLLGTSLEMSSWLYDWLLD